MSHRHVSKHLMSSRSCWVVERLLCAAVNSYLCNVEIFFIVHRQPPRSAGTLPTLSEAPPHWSGGRHATSEAFQLQLTSWLVEMMLVVPQHTHTQTSSHIHTLPLQDAPDWLDREEVAVWMMSKKKRLWSVNKVLRFWLRPLKTQAAGM